VGSAGLDRRGTGDQARGIHSTRRQRERRPEIVAATSPGTLFSEMTLANMASRAITGTNTRGCQERTGSISRSRPMATPTSPSGHGTAIAADIREFAEALVTLGDLRDSGLLTDEEFNDQKGRLLAR